MQEKEPALPTIHEAERAFGPSGAVEYGDEIDLATAIARRLEGDDVVVRGSKTPLNRKLAQRIETGVGPPTLPQAPEENAGPLALPHFQQKARGLTGHSFYETGKKKARKSK